MATVPLPIVGPSYQSRSIPLSAQITRGLYPEVNQDARSVTAFHSFPGLKPWATLSGSFRGFGEHQGALYAVFGGNLYRVSSGGVVSTIGAVSGSGRCILQSDGTNLYIATGASIQYYDGSTIGTVPTVDGTNWCAFLNSQMIYDGSDNTFWTATAGDGTDVNGLSFASAEASPDNLIRGYVFLDTLYLIGERTIESWYNSGVGNPPFDRVQGGTLPIGCAARHSVANNDSALYLLGDDRQVYRVAGQNYQAIGSIGVAHALEGYLDVSDAVGMCTRFEGQNFYVLTFPSEERTWAFHEASNAWFELGYGAESTLWRGAGIIEIYGKRIIADHSNGKLYTLDLETYTDNGQVLARQRDTVPIHSMLFGAPPGKRLFQSRLELIMETGVGLAGTTPQIMMSFSDDSGRTWSTETWGQMGEVGAYTWRVEWFQLGSFYSRVYRFRVTDPVPVSIFQGVGDIEVEP